MSEWFHVGQKVVCIDASRNSSPYALAVGATYTITAIDRSPAYDERDNQITPTPVSVKVLEIDMAKTHWFHADRFRPLRERKTDISIFTAMLNPSKAPVDA